jgi:hypothetical protein
LKALGKLSALLGKIEVLKGWPKDLGDLTNYLGKTVF